MKNITHITLAKRLGVNPGEAGICGINTRFATGIVFLAILLILPGCSVVHKDLSAEKERLAEARAKKVEAEKHLSDYTKISNQKMGQAFNELPTTQQQEIHEEKEKTQALIEQRNRDAVKGFFGIMSNLFKRDKTVIVY